MKIFLATFTLLINYALVFSQNKNTSSIAGIRKIVQQINTDTGYIVKQLNTEEFLKEAPDNGAELKGYFKKDRLVKITEWIGLSSCVNITEYYLDAGKLLFTYTKGSQSPYNDSLQTLDDTKSDLTMEYRFYFENGKLIHSILKGSSRCSGEPSIALAAGILKDCERYKKLLLKK